MAKIGQNGEEYGHMEQVDMADGPGAQMPCRHAPHGHHQVPPWHRPHHRSMGALLSQWEASIQVGLINGQDWKPVDP